MAKTPVLDRQHGFGEQHTIARNDYLSRRGKSARKQRARMRDWLATFGGHTQRTPLHPQALRCVDMTVGRKIIRVNLALGVLGEYTVTEEPHPYEPNHAYSEPFRGYPMVSLAHFNTYSQTMVADEVFCTDLGLLPEDGNWNTRNFVLDATDRHLLPVRIPALLRLEFGARFYELDDEFDEYDRIPEEV